MPMISVIAIRMSLGLLCTGSLLGFTVAVCRVLALPYFSKLLQAHWSLMLFGWLLQFSIATAYWMFPKFGTERPSGNVIMAGLILLNIGCIGIASLGSGWCWIVVMSGVVTCLFALKSRIKPHLGRP